MGDVKDCFEHTVTPPKTKVTMEKQRFEDVSSDKIVQKRIDVQFSRVYLFWNPAEALWKPWDLLSFQAASLSLVPGRTWWDKKNNEVFNKLFDGGKTSSIEKSSKKKRAPLSGKSQRIFSVGSSIFKPLLTTAQNWKKHLSINATRCWIAPPQNCQGNQLLHKKNDRHQLDLPPHPGCQWHFAFCRWLLFFHWVSDGGQMKV